MQIVLMNANGGGNLASPRRKNAHILLQQQQQQQQQNGLPSTFGVQNATLETPQPPRMQTPSQSEQPAPRQNALSVEQFDALMVHLRVLSGKVQKEVCKL